MALADTIEAVQSGQSPEVARLESKPQRTPFQERLHSVASTAAYIGISVAKSAGRVSTSAVDLGYMGAAKAVGDTPKAIEWDKVPVLKNTPSYQRTYEMEKEKGGSAGKEVAMDIGEDILNLAPIKILQLGIKYGPKTVGAWMKAAKAKRAAEKARKARAAEKARKAAQAKARANSKVRQPAKTPDDFTRHPSIDDYPGMKGADPSNANRLSTEQKLIKRGEAEDVRK